MLEFQVAVTKTHKYASRESGDTVELVERPHGGISVFLVDAQGSGQAAKTISNLVISRGTVMIKEGARDGAVARSLHDYLFTLRYGRVSATLNILSVDLQTRSVVLSRNDENPAYLFSKEGIELHDEEAHPIGIYTRTKPAIIERAITPYMGIVMTSDGIVHAGKRKSMPFNVQGFLEDYLAQGWPDAQDLADAVFERALELEDGRPRDDVTAIVLTIVPGVKSETPVRRLVAWLPIE